MSDRMTVVFEDADLLRRLRVWAAEHDVTMKRLIEDALRAYLGPESSEKPFDWDAFDRWQEEAEQRDRDLPPAGVADGGRRDGAPSAARPLLAAEEPAAYRP